MNLSEILLLPLNPNPRIIRAADTGQVYTIAAFAPGSTATAVTGVIGTSAVSTNVTLSAVHMNKVLNVSGSRVITWPSAAGFAGARVHIVTEAGQTNTFAGVSVYEADGQTLTSVEGPSKVLIENLGYTWVSVSSSIAPPATQSALGDITTEGETAGYIVRIKADGGLESVAAITNLTRTLEEGDPVGSGNAGTVASGILDLSLPAIDGNFQAWDTITFGDTVFNFRNAPDPTEDPLRINVGVDFATTLATLISTVSTLSDFTVVFTAPYDLETTAKTDGVAGNAVITHSHGGETSTVTLTGGTDGNVIPALAADHIGQWCSVATADPDVFDWWQWNGSEWIFVRTDGEVPTAADASVTAESPTTGNIVLGLPLVDETHYLTPAGTNLNSLTWTLPSAVNSRVGQVKVLWSSKDILALTVSVDGGGVLVGDVLTSAVAKTPYSFQCVSIDGTGAWLRLTPDELSVVQTTPQTLTYEQALQARANIKAVGSDTTGITGAIPILNTVAISQEDYDDIALPDPNTNYIITNALELTTAAALTFAGVDPNVVGDLIVEHPLGPFTLPHTGFSYGYPVWYDGSAVMLVEVVGDVNLWRFEINPDLVVSGYSNTLPDSPVGLTTGDWAMDNGAAPTAITGGAYIRASHIGQLCKASSAWWVWDGSAWTPWATLAGEPCAYNATLSAWRKLTLTGADGSEILSYSAL